MLTRVLEPEVMDSPRDADDYDSMDHREVNQRFVADLLTALAATSPGRPPDGPILDLGAGTAQIPILLCQCLPTARIVAIDLAASMIALAERNVAAAGLGDRIRLEQIDAKRLPYDDGAFAASMSNSIVHHLADPSPALAEMARVTAAGGLLFVRDLMRPADEATLARLVDAYAAGANPHQRQLFRDSLGAALELGEIREAVRSLGYPAESVQATSDRHWTWSARRIADRRP